MTGLAREHAAIVACVRRGFGQNDASVSARAVDWDAFLAEAGSHGLAPLVHSGIGALDASPPDDVARVLRANRAIAALRHQTAFAPALRDTVGTLERAGIEPIVLKGAALSYLAYPIPGLRTMADIDLLLPPDQVQRASEALCAAGYQMAPNYLPANHHHLPPLITPAGQFAIELHHHVLPEANPYAIDMRGPRARARREQLGDVEALVLAPEDALLHICVHLAWGHRYEWFPLRTLVDILALTRARRTAVDWGRFLALVAETRTAGAVYWPLRLSRVWLHAPVPEEVLTRLAPSAVVRRLVQVVIESPYVLSGEAPPEPGTAVLYHLLRELSLYSGCSRREQAGALWRGLFPTPDAIAHLPAEVTDSRLRYALNLWYPLRLARGLAAACALLMRFLLQPDTGVAPRASAGVAPESAAVGARR